MLAAEPHSSLEMGAVIEVVRGRKLGNFERPSERGARGDEGQGGPEVVFDVGPKMKPAARSERTDDICQKSLVEDASFVVPLLPPRVGKINMNGDERVVRHELIE